MMFGLTFPGIKLTKSELRLHGVVILMERSFLYCESIAAGKNGKSCAN